jgi:hypothetical protein
MCTLLPRWMHRFGLSVHTEPLGLSSARRDVLRVSFWLLETLTKVVKHLVVYFEGQKEIDVLIGLSAAS